MNGKKNGKQAIAKVKSERNNFRYEKSKRFGIYAVFAMKNATNFIQEKIFEQKQNKQKSSSNRINERDFVKIPIQSPTSSLRVTLKIFKFSPHLNAPLCVSYVASTNMFVVHFIPTFRINYFAKVMP